MGTKSKKPVRFQLEQDGETEDFPQCQSLNQLLSKAMKRLEGTTSKGVNVLEWGEVIYPVVSDENGVVFANGHKIQRTSVLVRGKV